MIRKVLIVGLLFVVAIPCTAVIIYVDDDGHGVNDGSSWVDAFVELQSALDVATSNDEIFVAQGTYKPDYDVATDTHTRDRSSTFQLLNDVKILGGFAGYGHTNPNSRAIERFKTVLSGDLSGDDEPGFLNVSENVSSVVTGSGVNNTAILHGFIITGGRGSFGGGMKNINGSPKISNCRFIANSVSTKGSGMYNLFGAPKVFNCIFAGNNVFGDMYEAGGAICYVECNWPELRHCTIVGNSYTGTQGLKAGAVRNIASFIYIDNCIIWGNDDYDIAYEPGSGWFYINRTIADKSTLFASIIFEDPLLVNAIGADGYYGTDDDNLRVMPGSPCIDNGTGAKPLIDFAGNPRKINGKVDIGAYEFLPGNFDFDNDVDEHDLYIMVATWLSFEGSSNWNPSCNLNGDSTIDVVDLAMFGEYWLTGVGL